jgi:hypothetical protein
LKSRGSVEELDLEYASIESVISSTLLLTLQKDEHILAGVTESIESVVQESTW